MGKVVGAILNDWRLAGVLTAGSGEAYDLELQLPEQRQQPEPDRLARLQRPDRTTSAIRAAAARATSTAVQRHRGERSDLQQHDDGVGSQHDAWLRGQARGHVTLARHPHGRQQDVRVPPRRVQPVRHGHLHQRATRSSITTARRISRVRNSQTLADGSNDPARLVPRNAGFGAATNAMALRSMQLQFRFAF